MLWSSVESFCFFCGRFVCSYYGGLQNTVHISNKLEKGDLVFHLLYGREWIGILLDIIQIAEEPELHKELAIVAMQPGTKYENFFLTKVSKNRRITNSKGMVSINWLRKIQTPSNTKTQ